MGIDDKSSHPELCSGVADGVTRNMVCLFREPDAGNLPVRFDEREQETEPSQTGLRWRGESQVDSPPGDYSYCACSRLYSQGLWLGVCGGGCGLVCDPSGGGGEFENVSVCDG